MKEFIKKIAPPFLLNWYHFVLAFFGAVIYRFPSKEVKIIGVTGTNGKSTVVEMTTKILEEADFKVASLSSIRFKIGGKERPNLLRMTMPGRFKLQKFLRETVNRGCQYAVLEVTSEGIKQNRHKFINFDVVVLTNLAPEHIEAHGGFENYKKAKGKLFQDTKKVHIINLDDENVGYFLQFPASKKIGFTVKRKQKVVNKKDLFTVHCSLFTADQNGVNFTVQNTKFNLKLFGEFNVYNALAAICVGLSQDISLETCKKALEKITGIPGRMEQVISEPFKVIVDCAYTPNALEKVYQTIRETRNRRQGTRMICVLGACGGGRDKWKRPVLGKLAAKYCNEVIVTNEDPYDESPVKIIEQIAEGTQGKAKKVLDRREAIKKALGLAKQGDTVVITGKGCESCICVDKGRKIPWDDRKVVKEEFEKL